MLCCSDVNVHSSGSQGQRYSQDQSQQYNLVWQYFSCAAPSAGLLRSGLEYTFSMTQQPIQGIQAYRFLPKWGIWGNTRNLQFSTHMLSRFIRWDVCECVYTKNLFPFLIAKLSSFASEEQVLQGVILVCVWGNLCLPHGLQERNGKRASVDGARSTSEN